MRSSETSLSSRFKCFISRTEPHAGTKHPTPLQICVQKVRLQTQSATNPIYSGLGDCVRKTLKNEGFGGFYKGVASPLWGQMFLNAWQFGVWGKVKPMFANPKSGEMETSGFFKAGAVTGALVALVESPVDLFKTQLQTQVFKQKPLFNTFYGCVKHIVKEHGVRGVFQGLPATAVRNTVAVAMYFGFYEKSKQWLASGQETPATLPAWKLMLAGGIGGLFYWPLIYPVDVAKSAMQADNLVKNRQYPTLASTFSQLYKEGGVKRFFPGFAPCMMRALPANAVCFTGYELTVKYLKQHFGEH